MIRWVVTCEHAGNRVPAQFEPVFRGADAELRSHRGWDPGAVEMFEALAPLADWSARHDVTRLLVETNRSRHHRRLFSEYTRDLPPSTREEIVRLYYTPHRDQVEGRVTGFLEQGGAVVHVGVHTFTPEMNGKLRDFDVGLLYDPARLWERTISGRWKSLILAREEGLQVRFNQPYRGAADGFTTYLRRRLGPAYAGLELEVNQGLFRGSGKGWDPSLLSALVGSFREIRADPPAPSPTSANGP